ncbi:MAG: PspA/IM30 family protein, partial [Actinomycetota bacterium]
MAGVIKRTMDLFRSKANKALDAAEDPRDTLDLGYKQMQDQVVELRRALADVATQRKRLELEAEKQQAQAAKLQDQAKAALDQGNEDLAREALTRRAAIAQHLSELESQHATVVEQEQRVAKSVEAIEAKVQAMRAEKELLKSSYTAAEAEAKAG